MGVRLLRMPRAQPQPHGVKHLGIVVEKTGEDNNESKKNRVMYLYSNTVRKHCGKLVCSVDWRDYELGNWMSFTQAENESYFGSTPLISDNIPYPTRVVKSLSVTVQVYAYFFMVPRFISCRETRHLDLALRKAWSPELGGVYVDVKSFSAFQIEDRTLYKGWIQYTPNQANFSVEDQDPEGWPYEPGIYWHVQYDSTDNNRVELIENYELFEKFFNTFTELAVLETHAEMEKRQHDKNQLKMLNKKTEIPFPNNICALSDVSDEEMKGVDHLLKKLKKL